MNNSTNVIKNLLRIEGRVLCCCSDAKRYNDSFETNYEHYFFDLNDFKTTPKQMNVFLLNNIKYKGFIVSNSIVLEFNDFFLALSYPEVSTRQSDVTVTKKNVKTKLNLFSQNEYTDYRAKIVIFLEKIINGTN